MALRDNIKNFVKKTVDSVAQRFSTQPEEQTGQQTLNEQINNGTINQPQTQNQESVLGKTETTKLSDIANGGADDVRLDTTPSTPTEGMIKVQGADLIQGDINKALAAEEEKSKKSSWEVVNDWVSSLPSKVDGLLNSVKANREAQANEKKVAIGYNKDNSNLLYLDIDDRRHEGTESLFNKYQREFEERMNQPGLTEMEQAQAIYDFYNNTKGLFKIKEDDYYMDGFLGNVGRRKNQYTQEQLDSLAANVQNNGLKGGDYIEPSYDERQTWLQTQYDNIESRSSIYAGRGLTPDEDDTTINLSQAAQTDWFQGMNDRALIGVADQLKKYMRDGNKRQGAEARILSAFDNQFKRVYTILEPVYAKEQLVLAKPADQRTEGEKKLLEIANKFRAMEKAMADGLNNWAMQQIRYGRNENGDIDLSLTYFENGQSLGDVLSSGVKAASGEDWKSYHSNIDVFQQMANEALYQYEKGKGTTLGNARERGQHALAPVGWGLGEFGQQTVKYIGKTISIPLYIAQGDSSEGIAPSTEYMDQDFTIGMLIETDDGNVKRTVKKYLLEGLEYVPEAIGNLVPDIAISALTMGGGAITALSKAGRAYKAVKTVEGLNTINKISKITKYAKGAKTGIEALDAMADAAKAAGGMRQTLGVFMDRAITQGIIDQAMDAQRSGFDTEAYSTTSFLLSTLGTFGFNIIPELSRAELSGFVKKLINDDAVTGTVWDIVDYMASSPEATNNIARLLNKSAGNVSVDDLAHLVKNFTEVSNAAKVAFENLPQAGKDAANKWTKQVMFNQINQIFGGNSEVAKAARRILNNGSTNAADLIKYIGKIPGDVSFGPYTSTIKFKYGTEARAVLGDNADVLSSIDGGFMNKLNDGFTQLDIENLSSIKGYGDILTNQKEFFDTVGDKKFLTPKGLKRLDIKTTPLQSLGVEISSAENAREIFRERMKSITNKDKAIKDATIDSIADTGAYDEVVAKVSSIIC